MMNKQNLKDALELSSNAFDTGVQQIERIHKGIAREPFAILARVPLIRRPAAIVETVHNGITDFTYGCIKFGGKFAHEGAKQVVQSDLIDIGSHQDR